MHKPKNNWLNVWNSIWWHASVNGTWLRAFGWVIFVSYFTNEHFADNTTTADISSNLAYTTSLSILQPTLPMKVLRCFKNGLYDAFSVSSLYLAYQSATRAWDKNTCIHFFFFCFTIFFSAPQMFPLSRALRREIFIFILCSRQILSFSDSPISFVFLFIYLSFSFNIFILFTLCSAPVSIFPRIELLHIFC